MLAILATSSTALARTEPGLAPASSASTGPAASESGFGGWLDSLFDSDPAAPGSGLAMSHHWRLLILGGIILLALVPAPRLIALVLAGLALMVAWPWLTAGLKMLVGAPGANEPGVGPSRALGAPGGFERLTGPGSLPDSLGPPLVLGILVVVVAVLVRGRRVP